MKSEKENNVHPIVSMEKIEVSPDIFDSIPDYDNLPLLPTRNLVMFPGVTTSIALTRQSSLEVANYCSEKHLPLGLVCQSDPDAEFPEVPAGIYKYGVFADILKVVSIGDNNMVLLRSRGRFRVMGAGSAEGFPEKMQTMRVKPLQDRSVAKAKQHEFSVLMDNVCELAAAIMEKSSAGGTEFKAAMLSQDSMEERLNFIATNVLIDPRFKGEALAKVSLFDRAACLLTHLAARDEELNLSEEIMKRARSKIEENQRNMFLQTQLETIRESLYGDESDDTEELAARAEATDFTPAARQAFDKELAKMKKINPSSADYSVVYNYLDTLLELPWGKKTETNTDFASARNEMECAHYGLEKVKQRILEQIAVLMNNPDVKSPIICLVGPPGVGKTSLGRSIAKAMGRVYERVSLGGVHDEAEIRGHRRTYIGAMPGRIIAALKKAGTSNPVMLLDEIDKVGRDHKGDPSSALLEVLDPEQNVRFHDNFVDVDFNLSNVLFIATANTLSTIDRPLLDRMEVIEISGYILEEKVEIALRHLLTKVCTENGVAADEFKISREAIVALIENYTNESGVRQLEKQLANLVRKMILAKMSGEEFPAEIEPSDLRKLLGLPLYNRDKYENNDTPGVVTGLAWTQTGGEILLAESSLSPGKGDRLTITGNLGDVMKESATIALQWVKAHSEALGIEPEKFDRHNLHIHFPEGAIPKDGPSAGITIATAIASAFTGRKVRERLAMTGEITLRGKVLPVGGIKEKILAARRAGITDVVLCSENRKDVDDIGEQYLTGLNFHYVDKVDEVISFALV